MIYGIIDIGSNTIRLIICDIHGEIFTVIGNDREKSILIDSVYDRKLSKKGIDFLTNTILRMKTLCNENNCIKIYAFATASLRNIENKNEVCVTVKYNTGIDIKIISGVQEAIYDYEGLKITKNTYDGVGFDLGGGSCQLLRYSKGKLDQQISLMLGSLRMYNKFVLKEIPTSEEASEIYNYIISELSIYDDYNSLGYETIYAMGGTARSALLLYENLTSKTLGFKIDVKQIKWLYNHIISMNDLGVELIRQQNPERVNSLIPGIITICAICDYTKATTLEYAICGVREGFIVKELLNNK